MALDNMESFRAVGHLDKVGTWVSLGCAIHCVLVPFFITILPLLGLSFLKEGPFEVGMIIFAVTVATLSLCWGSRIHGTHKTLLFVAAALVFFIFGHEHHSSAHWYFMATGGLCLVAGHLLNRHLCRTCSDCRH